MHRIERDIERDAAREGWYEIDNSDEPVEVTVGRILALIH